jgi:hypothetical protein
MGFHWCGILVGRLSTGRPDDGDINLHMLHLYIYIYIYIYSGMDTFNLKNHRAPANCISPLQLDNIFAPSFSKHMDKSGIAVKQI